MLTIDSTGLHALRDVVQRSRRDGTLWSSRRTRPAVVALVASGAREEDRRSEHTGNLDDALNSGGASTRPSPGARPAFATPTVTRES